MPAPSAFISYSREDSEFALRLAQDLKAAGAPIWLDQIDIDPGHPWDNAIEDALNGAPLMLLILSPSSAKSDNVRNEISYALEAGKIIIPVLYRDCVVPLRLQRTQRIDFRADYARGLAALLQNLKVAQPDPAVLERAAEGDALRQAAWHAREAEAKRLRDALEPANSKALEPKSPERAAPQPNPPARSASFFSLGLIFGAIALVAVVLYFVLRRPADRPRPVVITQPAPIVSPPTNPAPAPRKTAPPVSARVPIKGQPASKSASAQTSNPFNFSAPGASAYGPARPSKTDPFDAADNLITGKSSSLPSSSVVGTTWAYTDLSMGSTPVMRLEFQAGGNLRAIWLASSTTYDHCSWKQTGDTISFQFDNQYQQFHGHIAGSKMTGTAINKPGVSWNWMATRQ